ncbi:MAG: acyltransferase [Candidatus Eisenbacteria bacterium]|nr:acyltransferase [Candidatus Eisenbacteria bacterium]
MAELLSRRLGGRRDNNFNLLRFLAAAVVIYSHSFPMSGAPSDPLERLVGFSFGHLAVDVFFVISGFLVTGSLLSRRDLASFAAARALRLFPVLLVGALLGALVVGPLQTHLPPGAYFANPATWKFVAMNSVPWPLGVCYTLPGVFLNVPVRGAVNGSLWSLPWEMSMYVTLAALGALAYTGPRVLSDRLLRRVLVGIGVVATLGFTLYEAFDFPYQFHVSQALRLTSLFFGGATLMVASARVPLSGRLALAAAALLVLDFLLPRPLMAVYAVTLTYLVVWLAYAPAGPLAFYRRVGDYSYGTYVYAFPIGQCMAAWVPGISAAGIALATLPLTLALAVPSWHLLEERMLSFKADRRA